MSKSMVTVMGFCFGDLGFLDQYIAGFAWDVVDDVQAGTCDLMGYPICLTIEDFEG